MSEIKIDRETAEFEFERFAEAMDLNFDMAGMDKEDSSEFSSQKERIVRAIMAGKMVVNDKGEPVYTPGDGEAITFYEPTGATYASMDKRKQNESMAKINVMLGEMTKTNPAVFSKMKNRDYKVCQAVITLFLAG